MINAFTSRRVPVLATAAMAACLVAAMVSRASGVTTVADCHWEIKGRIDDHTGQPIKNKVLKLWSQLASGNPADPDVSGPRELVWGQITTGSDGTFVARTTKPLSQGTCTRSRVIGGTIGANNVDIGLFGPYKGPAAEASLHIVEVGVLGIGVSAADVK